MTDHPGRTATSLCLCVLSAFGCSHEADPVAGSGDARRELVVYAASSTRDVLQPLAATYERVHEVAVVFNFGSSGDLASQILAAAKADVFLSADEKEMERVATAGLVAADTRVPLLSNQLVVIEPADLASHFSKPFEARQLALPAVRLLSLGDPATVPAGKYAKAWLEQCSVWAEVGGRVLPGVDVRAALAAVEAGGAEAGIVYRTDAARSAKVRIVHTVLLDEGPKIVYPVAAMQGRPEARAFVEYLQTPDARRLFEDAGFVFLPAAPK